MRGFTPDEDITGAVADQLVLAGAANQDVAGRTAEQEIIARPTQQHIGSVATKDRVVIGPAVEDRRDLDRWRDTDRVIPSKSLDVDRVDRCHIERADLLVIGFNDNLMMASQSHIDLIPAAASLDVEHVSVEHGGGRHRSRRIGRNLAEEAVRFVVRTGGIVKRVRVAGLSAIAERQPPQAFYRDRMTVGFQRAFERAGTRVIDVDPTVAEIADKELVAEIAKIGGRLHDAPRGVELAL